MTPSSQHHSELSPADLDVDVLVVGAGPTGLTAAAEALRRGLRVRIVEKKEFRDGFSKALVVHARTMETFSFMGIDHEVREVGATFAALNLHFNNRGSKVRVDLVNQPWGDTQYPYWLSVPQYETEVVLERHLRTLGGDIEWSTALRSVTDHGNFVEATVDNSEGTHTIRARWVIGCDGGRSTARDHAGITLERTGAKATFLLADVKTSATLVEDEGHLFLAPEGLIILVPMPEPRRWRVIAHMIAGAAPTRARTSEGVDAKLLDELVLDRTGITFGAHDVTWTSQFDLSHGVADRFFVGRVFVAGDAAHVHSPVGGQGLNTGVQDAYNLVWRLAESLRATPENAKKLIQGYEAERRGTAGPMVQGVARMTAVMTSRRHLAKHLRSFLAPRVLSRRFVQAKLARGVGMLNLSYARRFGPRDPSPWGEGHRLPNPELRAGGRLYDLLGGTGYNWIVRDDGAEGPDLPAADSECWKGLRVVVISESDLVDTDKISGKNRIVLVRPDRYIAGIGPDAESLHAALLAEGAERTRVPGAVGRTQPVAVESTEVA